MTGFAVVLDGPASLRAFVMPKNAPRAIATKLTNIPGVAQGLHLATGPSSVCARTFGEKGRCSLTRCSNGSINAFWVPPSRNLEALFKALSITPSRLMDALMVTKQGTGSAMGSLAVQWPMCNDTLRVGSSRMLAAMT